MGLRQIKKAALGRAAVALALVSTLIVGASGGVVPAEAVVRAATSADVTVPGTPGAATVGTTTYAVPSGAIVASPAGNDSAAGTLKAPVRTLKRALALVRSGGTIVLRAGTYHETVAITRSAVTIQSYPNEAVWFDGSVAVGGWTKSGNVWLRNGWTAQFDSSPTYIRGRADYTDPNWRMVSAAYPMAAHPDQVWVDSTAQRQVSSSQEVTAGTFYADYANKRLVLGTAPTGKTVRASDLTIAIAVQAPDVVLRGFGVRRYAVAVPDMGAIRVDAPGVRAVIENVAITDNATGGLSVSSANATVHRITSTRNGLLGVHSVYADGMLAGRMQVTYNNLEHFNAGPVAGGMKIGRSRSVSILNSRFAYNEGVGLWCDEECESFRVISTVSRSNAGTGIVFELSSGATMVNNRVLDNGYAGIEVHNSGQVAMWNNTVAGSRIPVWLNQDARRPTSASTPGRDPRRPFPDPVMTWQVKDVRISNTIMAQPVNSPWCAVLCVYDQTATRPASQMNLTVLGNLFHRTVTTTPWALVRWSVTAPGGGWLDLPTVGAFRASTGQGQSDIELTGANPMTTSGYALASVQARANSVAVTIPTAIAAGTALPVGGRVLGAVP